ncbi:hypothetical protein V5G65_03600 [Mammaliicoccus sciuri]|uniref:hypothetical protein n=1 Tax=Mammaliicoccus sciuri TaxID=1296 RepID=UPI0037A96628
MKQALLESFLNAASQVGSDSTKELLTSNAKDSVGGILMDIGLDTSFGMVPGLGNAYIGHKMNKRHEIMKEFLRELNRRQDSLEKKMGELDDTQKEFSDVITELALETALNTKQKDKIKLIINGIENTLGQDISFDMTVLYFSILDRLTLLEIELLKIKTSYNRDEDWYRKLLSDFNVTHEGYKAAESNLVHNGLMEVRTETYLQKDIDLLIDHVEKLQSNMNKIDRHLQGKDKKLNLSNMRRVRNRTKDVTEVSKLGRDFMNYFINSEE